MVIFVSDLSESVIVSVNDFFGEYHCGFSLVGNVEVVDGVADDVDGAGSVRVSKEETEAIGAIGSGTSDCSGGLGGDRDGGAPDTDDVTDDK